MPAKPRIGLHQQQLLKLTPGMRSSLSLLRMPADQLIEEISREAAENPFLVVRHRISVSAYEVALATVAGQDSLSVSLAHQIDLQRLEDDARAAAFFLITQLREDGYLDTSLPELARDISMPLALLERGLAALQRCEPTGVGARNLAECLELQLVEKRYDPAQARAIVGRLEDFAQNRLARVAKDLGLSKDHVARIARDIRDLTPAPVADERAIVVARIPDLLIERQDGTLTLSLNPDAYPRISLARISPATLDSPELRQCYDRARNLARGVSSRNATLLRIGRHIVDAQASFFLIGPTTLNPESQAAAAKSLGMHPSTIGRALAGKALTIDGKVYALAQFFSRALPTTDGMISAFDIQARLRALILAEDRQAPLADEAICTHFKNEGVDIARRTIAKYRKCMRIPSSFKRRRRTVSEPAASQAKPK